MPLTLVQQMMNMATKGNKSGSVKTDPLKVVQASGITNTKFEGLTEAEKNKVGLVTGEVMQAGYTELVKKNAEETKRKWEALKNYLDPKNEYGLVVTSVLREGSTDHSQGLAIDISTTKSPKYLFRFYAERIVREFLKLKWGQIVRSVEGDYEVCKKWGVYKAFLSIHNYHIHLSMNPNRGRLFGFETYNGGDPNLSSSYPILDYDAMFNTMKAMDFYNITSAEIIMDNTIEIASDSIKGIGSSIADNATESPSKLFGTISVIALIFLAIFLFFKGVKK